MVKTPFKDSTATLIFWAILLTALLPWLYLRCQQATHSDILWLTEALQRVLAGGKMSEVAYETNPPLSMVIYILPVLAKSFLHIPLHYAVLAQTLILTALSTLAVHKILSTWKIFQAADINIMTAGYLLGVTAMPSIYFGERDHLLALGLVPFVLMQVSLTYRLPRPKGWTIPVLALGAVLILLKPHHGLLPTILLAHRAISQRRLSVAFDPDFLSLAIAVLAYLAMALLVFPDYAFIVFPDVMKLYLAIGKIDNIFPKLAGFIVLPTGIFLLTSYLKMPTRENYLVLFLTACSLAGTIPFVVQKMGFYYHLAPSIAFLAMAITLVFFHLLKQEIKRPLPCLLVALLFLLGIAFLVAPREKLYPDHHYFATTPLAKLVSTCPDQPTCSFFLFNSEMGLMHEISYYTGIPHASRFPSLWFLPAMFGTLENIENGKAGPLTPEELQSYFTRFSGMVAEDINRWKPYYLIVWDWGDAFPEMDFIDYMSQNEAFQEAIKPYKKTGTLSLDYGDYYGDMFKDQGSRAYTLYERR